MDFLSLIGFRLKIPTYGENVGKTDKKKPQTSN